LLASGSLRLRDKVRLTTVLKTARRAGDSGLAVPAYGLHTKPNLLRVARVADRDLAVPRSKLVDELPQVIERAMRAA
jgi:hypothetical protein